MEFDEFWLLRKGWDDKLLWEESVYRKMTLIIASAMVGGKNIKPDSIWPFRGDQSKVKMVTKGGVQMSERLAIKLDRAKQRAKLKKTNG